MGPYIAHTFELAPEQAILGVQGLGYLPIIFPPVKFVARCTSISSLSAATFNFGDEVRGATRESSGWWVCLRSVFPRELFFQLRGTYFV